MRRIIYLLIVICLLVGLAGVIGGCAEASGLKLTLNDLYYKKYYYEAGIIFENLFAELTLEAEGKEPIRISENHLQDAEGTIYPALLLNEEETEEECCGGSIIRPYTISVVPAGWKRDGYFMVIGDVPRNATGLKLCIETDAGQAVLSLPDADSIKVIEVVVTP